MAFCSTCGKPVNAGTPFCPACGAGIPPAGAGGPAQGFAPAPTPVAAAPVAYGPSLVAPPATAQVRPTGITIIGGVMIVGGVLTLVIGGGLLVFALATGALAGAASGMPFLGLFAGMFVLVFLFIFLFAALFGILGIAVGMGLLKGRSWARAAAIVLMVLNGLRGLGSISFDLRAASVDGGGLVSGLITLAVSGLVIWYLFRPEVKDWFERTGS